MRLRGTQWIGGSLPLYLAALLCAVLTVTGCKGPSSSTAHAATEKTTPKKEKAPTRPLPQAVRATGKVQAVKVFMVQVPRITGRSGRVTLSRLVPNGSQVREGDVLAEFDRTAELDKAREAKAKYEDLGHQVEEKEAQNRSNAQQRSAELQQAKADLAKARLQLRKGPVLSDIDRLKAQVKLEEAQAHVASLQKSSHFHDRAEAAALRVLELQRDRQKVGWERALNNVEKLLVHAPLAGTVVLESVWRNNTWGQPQEGDQLWRGQSLLRIFDPSEMEVLTFVDEPDGAVLVPGCRARVRLDAYPDLVFNAHLRSASPVAAKSRWGPLRTFAAIFRLEEIDPHLLPDLSARLIIEPGESRPGVPGGEAIGKHE